MILALALLSSTAHAARMTRCDVALELPVGQVTVAGWASDPAGAAWRASQAARTLAELHLQADRWAGLLTRPEATVARMVAHWDAGPTGEGQPAPGYRITPGDCVAETLPTNRENAWQATWDGGDPVLRAAAADAVEAARRRTCFGRMQRAIQHLLVGWDRDRETVDPTGAVLVLQDARDGLVRCATGPAPAIAAALAPLPSHGGGDLYECVRARPLAGGWGLTPGWGTSLDSAREAALMRDLRTLARQVTGDALAALGGERADPAPAVRSALRPLEAQVVGSDVVEQAALLCRTGPGTRAHYAWRPSPAIQVGCGTPPTPTPVPLQVAALEDLGEARCDGVRLAAAQAAVQLAGAGDLGASAGALAVANTCSASCARDVVLDGWETVPSRRENELARATGDDASASLRYAIAHRDAQAFGVLTGGIMLEPRYAAVAASNPQVFWGSLEAAIEDGRMEAISEWQLVRGHWLLVFGPQAADLP